MVDMHNADGICNVDLITGQCASAPACVHSCPASQRTQKVGPHVHNLRTALREHRAEVAESAVKRYAPAGSCSLIKRDLCLQQNNNSIWPCDLRRPCYPLEEMLHPHRRAPTLFPAVGWPTGGRLTTGGGFPQAATDTTTGSAPPAPRTAFCGRPGLKGHA